MARGQRWEPFRKQAERAARQATSASISKSQADILDRAGLWRLGMQIVLHSITLVLCVI